MKKKAPKPTYKIAEFLPLPLRRKMDRNNLKVEWRRLRDKAP